MCVSKFILGLLFINGIAKIAINMFQAFISAWLLATEVPK